MCMGWDECQGDRALLNFNSLSYSLRKEARWSVPFWLRGEDGRWCPWSYIYIFNLRPVSHSVTLKLTFSKSHTCKCILDSYTCTNKRMFYGVSDRTFAILPSQLNLMSKVTFIYDCVTVISPCSGVVVHIEKYLCFAGRVVWWCKWNS